MLTLPELGKGSSLSKLCLPTKHNPALRELFRIRVRSTARPCFLLHCEGWLSAKSAREKEDLTLDEAMLQDVLSKKR